MTSNTTPPPSTHTHRPTLTASARAALILTWLTPLAVAGWGWSTLPTSDAAGAPTTASLSSHPAATIAVAFVALIGLLGAAVATTEMAHPRSILTAYRVPAPVLVVAVALTYAAFAVVMLLSGFSSFAPGPLPEPLPA